MAKETKNLRKEISKILVKWSMPTRQVAIIEIIKLFPDRDEMVKRLEGEKKLIPENKWENSIIIQKKEDKGFNQAIDIAIKIVKGE